MWSKLFHKNTPARAAENHEIPGPRRRRHQRHSYEIPLLAKCSSWDSFHQLFSANISESGLYIPTDHAANLHDIITIQLLAPDGTTLNLAGQVVHIFINEAGDQKGIGVYLEPLEADVQEHYLTLVAEAAAQCRIKVNHPVTTERPVSPPSLTPNAIPEMPSAGGTPPRLKPMPPVTTTAETNTSVSDLIVFTEQDSELVEIPSKSVYSTRPASTSPQRTSSASQSSGPIVAMDFGTSMSSVAAIINHEVTVIQTPNGQRDIPSVVGFDNGKIFVGHEARALLATDPRLAIASPKRLLGRLNTDREIEPYLAALAMPHSANRQEQILVHAEGRTYTIPQICSFVLRRLKEIAEISLRQEIRKVILTAPVSFDPQRCQALREAATLAGLQPVDIIDEPTAAALSYSFDPDFQNIVAIYDFGGGTFDFSVVDVSSADFKVLATAGDAWLGGDDFDEAISNAAANAFWHQHGLELQKQVVQWQRLMLAAESAKRELSSKEQAAIEIKDAALTAQGPLHLHFTLTREAFSTIAQPIIERSFDTCREALELSGLQLTNLKAIYLSGGTSYIPAVREGVASFFGRTGKVSVPPDRAVVIGAAMHAAQLQSSRISFL